METFQTTISIGTGVQTTDEHAHCRNIPTSCLNPESEYDLVQNHSTAELVTKDTFAHPKYLNNLCGVQLACIPDSRRCTRSKPGETSIESSSSSIERCFDSKYFFYCVLALALLSVAFATGCGVKSLQLNIKCNELEKKITSLQTSFEQLSVHSCLPCVELSQGPFIEDNHILDNLIKGNENGTQTCCAKSADQFSVLLNLFVKRKQMEIIAEEILIKENLTDNICMNETGSGKPSSRSESISAHLVAGDQNISPNSSNEFQPIKNWNSLLPGAHLSNINMVDNNRLLVPESGEYFLYSQAAFFFYYDNTQIVEETKQSLFHVVYRYNAIYPLDGSEELLRSEFTQCWEKHKSFERYTSYVGASVRLNKGDQIYVKVSLIEFLSNSQQKTFLGLFKLG